MGGRRTARLVGCPAAAPPPLAAAFAARPDDASRATRGARAPSPFPPLVKILMYANLFVVSSLPNFSSSSLLGSVPSHLYTLNFPSATSFWIHRPHNLDVLHPS